MLLELLLGTAFVGLSVLAHKDKDSDDNWSDAVRKTINHATENTERSLEDLARKKSRDYSLSEEERERYREKYEQLHQTRIERGRDE